MVASEILFISTNLNMKDGLFVYRQFHLLNDFTRLCGLFSIACKIFIMISFVSSPT